MKKRIDKIIDKYIIEMKKDPLKTTIYIDICIFFVAVVIDSLNKINYYNRFNTSFLSIVMNGIITTSIFCITYFTLNMKTAEQESNKKNMAQYLLDETYKYILFYIKDDSVLDMIISDIRNNPNIHNTTIIFLEKCKATPFENEEKILNFAFGGILSREKIENYTYIKQLYEAYINGIIYKYSDDASVKVKRELLEQLKPYIRKEANYD